MTCCAAVLIRRTRCQRRLSEKKGKRKTNLTADRQRLSAIRPFQHFSDSLHEQEQVRHFPWREIRETWDDASGANEDICSQGEGLCVQGSYPKVCDDWLTTGYYEKLVRWLLQAQVRHTNQRFEIHNPIALCRAAEDLNRESTSTENLFVSR